MDFNNNRNTLFLALILIALGGVALAESSALVVLVLLGLLFLVRQFDNNAVNSSMAESYDYEYDYDYDYEYGAVGSRLTNEEEQEVEPTTGERVYRHALEAVTRAGLDPDEVQVLAVDIGMMAFSEDKEPVVFRTWTLPDDVDYVQPFVEVRLPTNANGLVKFEITDSAGDVVFVHEDNFNLTRGRNFLTPAARLPIHDQREMDGRWHLRVTADDVLLAVHRFEFTEATGAAIRRHIGEDGEINTELRAVMAESRLPKMSLDDLLAYQEDEEAQQSTN